MTDIEKSPATGIKVTLEKIDSEILKVNRDISDNALIILNLKNESAKLKGMFEAKFEEVQRNIKLDV